MVGVRDRGRLVPMSSETRGHAIKERMELLGIGTVRLAELAVVDRKTVARAVRGEASEKTFKLIEDALDRVERRVGPEVPAQAQPNGPEAAPRVTFRLRGIYGAREVIVEGPADTLDEIEAAVERLLRGNSESQGE